MLHIFALNCGQKVEKSIELSRIFGHDTTDSTLSDGFFDLSLEDTFADAEIVRVLLQRARMSVQMLERAAIQDDQKASYAELRENVTKSLFYLRAFLQDVEVKEVRAALNSFRLVLRPILVQPEMKSVFQASNGLKASARYQYLHGYFEWRWLYLSTLLKLDLQSVETADGRILLTDSQLENEFKLLLFDLFTVAQMQFQKFILERKSNLEAENPFPCRCIKDLWGLLHLLADQLNEKHFFGHFWTQINVLLEYLEKNNLDEYLSQVCTNLSLDGIFLRESLPNDSLMSVNIRPAFEIWLLAHLAATEDDQKDNYERLCVTLEILLKSDIPEDRLRSIFLLLIPLILEYWRPQVQIISILWDCIFRRLNSAFFMQNSTPDALAVVESPLTGYLDQVKSILVLEKLSISLSSFSLFLHLLGKSLSSVQQKRQIFGRIFSKFNATKLIGLSERGLHNFVMLIVTLALSGDFKETHGRLTDIMLQLTLNKLLPERQKIVTRGHLTLVILAFRKNLDTSRYLERFLAQLKEVSRENHSNLKLIALTLQEIVLEGHLSHGIHLFIASWIPLYLRSASSSDKRTLFDALAQISQAAFERRVTEMTPLLKALYEHVLPSIREHYPRREQIQSVPEVAAYLCLCATGRDGLPSAESLVRVFTDVQSPNVLYSLKFIILLLSNDPAKISPEIALQNWLKCCILVDPGMEETAMLTDLVFAKPNVIEPLQITRADIDPAKPVTLFSHLFRQFFQTDNYQKKWEVSGRAMGYLDGFERWAPAEHPPEATVRIFDFAAMILFHCAPMLYAKGKSNCFFNILFQKLILPTSVMMGKAPTATVCAAMARVFHVLVETLGKLDFVGDSTLQDRFEALIIKWTPFLNPSTPTLVKIFAKIATRNEEPVVDFVMKRFSEGFLALHGGRTPGPNAPMAANVLKGLFHAFKDDPEKLFFIFKGAMAAILEHGILAEDTSISKKVIVEFFQDFLSAESVQQSAKVQSLLASRLQAAAKQHLPQQSRLFFAFAMKLIKIHPPIGAQLLPSLRSIIFELEQLSGKGSDLDRQKMYEALEQTYKALVKKS